MQDLEKYSTDIAHDNVILRFVPERFRAYALLARVDRPIGFWLLALPGIWSIWLASDGFELRAVWLSFLFCVGAVAMRSAGCVINDIWDRDLDRKVERTAVRPLAAQDVSLRQAVLFLALLLCAGLVVLLQMNIVTVILGFLSVPLIIAYPLMKRITFWPQAFLGLTFNFGVLMGWSAVTEGIGLPAVLLYIGAIFWTLGYDTIYAHQDIEDDMRAGIKSTALKFGEKSKIWVGAFYALAFKFMLLGFVMVSPWTLIALVPLAWHFTYQLMRWQLHDAGSALKVFKSNRDAGFILLAAAIIGAFL